MTHGAELRVGGSVAEHAAYVVRCVAGQAGDIRSQLSVRDQRQDALERSGTVPLEERAQLAEEVELRLEPERGRVEREERAPEEERVQAHAHFVVADGRDELAEVAPEVTRGKGRIR